MTLHYRTSSGLVTSKSKGRYRNSSGQSIAFGLTGSVPGSGKFSFYTDADVTASAASFNDPTTMTLGTRLSSPVPLYSHGVRFLAPSLPMPTAALRACLFADVNTPTLTKDVPFTLPQASENTGGVWITLYWHEILWDAPVLIPANHVWTHAVVTNRYVARPSMYDAPITRGKLTASFQAGRFSALTPPSFPDGQFNSAAYFIDGIFSLAGA